MSRTVPDAYKYAAKSQSFNEDWLVQLYYGDESSFLGLATRDMDISSNQYYGVIINCGEIVQSIDLAQSKAYTGNVTMMCANTLKTDTLSAELLFKTNKYINRKVKIYSGSNPSALTDCVCLFEGRLIRIEHNAQEVTLEMEQQRPWDGIKIPDTKSPYFNYAPVTYGDFVQDTEANFWTSKHVYPCPFEKRQENKMYFVTGTESLASAAELYFYDSKLDKFIQITGADSSSTTSGSVEVSGVPIAMSREVRLRPIGAATGNEFTNTASCYAQDSNGAMDETTYAIHPSSGNDTQSGVGTTDYELRLKIEECTGIFTTLHVRTKAEVFVDFSETTCEITDTWSLINHLYDKATDLIEATGAEVNGEGGDYTESRASSTEDTPGNSLSAYQSNDNKMDTELHLKWAITGTDAGSELAGICKVYSVFLQGTISLDFTNEPEAAEKFLEDLDFMYCGHDGYGKDYTDGGGATASKIHEIHRDLMDRFSGLDYDNDYMDNWSDLDTARSGWTCHWWQSEPRLLSEILEQAQYEGCFIFVLVPDSDGSGNPGGRYIWVDKSYNSADATLSEDHYKDLIISHTDFKELVTKTTYNYDIHPATGKRVSTTAYTNITERTNWNIQTEENHQQRDLEFVTGDIVYNSLSHSEADDCIALYYDNIVAEPKILVTCTIVNPGYFDLEVGDIIKFSDSTIDAFGKTWSNLYFMITEERRQPQQLTITAREVYESA